MEVSFAEDESSDTATTIPTFDHNDLFAAAEESILSCRPLVNFFYTNNNNTDEDDNLTITQRRTAITNVVKSPQFNKGRARRLFTAVLPLLTKITEEESYMPDTDTDGNIIQDSYSGSTLSIQYIKCCAILVDAYLEGILLKQKNGRGGLKKMDDEIFEVAELLHDLLFPLQHGPVASGIKVATQAQSAIFSMCERYWHGNFEDKEQLVTQLIPLLLMKSLNDNAQKNDVKRLYSIREAIDLLDFQDESIESLKLHLLRVVGNPLFLQSIEGRKFITHLFQVDTTLVIDLHRAVRAQINGAKKSILNAYADIYYNAWKSSTEIVSDDEEEDEGEIGAIQQSIEENALQDFMYQVIHAAVPSTAKSVRVVLDKFYVNKKNPDVESMLHRMYGPLLWRALSGANSKVRIQASVVLSDTFPLRDPNASVEWTTACVKKSVEALVSLMKDDIPSCRVAGCVATAKILSLFWTAIPSQDIRLLLDQIIGKHTSDASSSAVRAAAVNAVTTLLEEEKSHAVLRPLLSNVGNLIHDKTEKVRLAVVNMLLFVKRLRGIKYYHVVPADHLLSRLADEGLGNNNPTGAVAVGLSNLLSNSFFPTGSKKTMSDIITRTLRLLTDSPQAAVVFYRNAPTQLSVNSISKLIAALMKCLCCFIIEEKKAKFEDVSNLTAVVPEYESIERPNHSSNTAQMATIAESISILWGSIEDDLKDAENEGSSEMLDEVFSGNVLTEVYCHFNSKFDSDDVEDANECYRACVAILNCAGKIDENKIEGLRVHIVNELSKSNDVPEDELITVNYSPSLSLLCAWGMTEDVAQCLASSIKLYFERGSDEELYTSTKRKSKRTKGKKGKKATNEDGTLPSLKVDVCLNILGHVLKGSYPASAAARTSILESEASFSALSSALLTAKSAAERMIEDPSTSQPNRDMIMNISIAIECYGRLLIHRDSMKGDVPIKLSPELKSLMTWATDILSPSLLKLQEDSGNNTLKDLDLSDISLISSPISAGPKKKASQASSPQLGNIGESSFMSTEADSVNNQVLSVTAISSIIRIFAEWLQLRYTDDSFVSLKFIVLCKLLESSNEKVVRKVMLPLLINVAGIKLRNDGDATLFKTILMSMRKVDVSLTEEKLISQSMPSILSMRDESLLKAAMSTVIHVTRKVVVEADESAELFTDKVGIFMSKVLEVVLSGKKSSLILTQCLLAEPETSAVRECLLKQIEEHATKTPALQKLLGTANKVETVEDEDDGMNDNEKTVVNVDVDKENTANQSEIILAA